MTDIQIITHQNELRTDSRLLASFLDLRHRTIFENITKYRSELSELGIVPFETERLNTERNGEREHKFALLNEDQCYFILTLMRNNERVVKAKLELVKAFRDARTQLANRDLARVDGKQIRKLETQSIKMLVDYAKAQGSKSADTYYMTITKMTNSILGIESGQRDNLDIKSLNEIKVLETIVSNAVSDGVNAKMNYKDIYKLAKTRCLMVSESMRALKLN